MTIKLSTYGGNADFCTDFGTSPIGATCHLPLSKLVWGDATSSYRVNETTPLPVQIMEVTGESLVVTGNMGASGSFPIINPIITGATTAPFIQYLAVAGSTTGDPVEVTGSVCISCPVEITGERYLNSSTDSVTVVGTVGISAGTLNLNSGTDSVSVYGWDGGRYVNTTLFAADGTTIGNSGDAINVNLVNTGTTFTFTAAATIGVTNDTQDADGALNIKGVSGAEPIAVKGRNGEAIEVTNSPTTAISVTGDFFIDGTQQTVVSEITRPNSIISGSMIVGYTAASQLPSNSLKTGITIKSHPSNIDFIYVGNSGISAGITTNGYILESGESLFLECNNSNLIYLLGISGDLRRVNYIGS